MNITKNQINVLRTLQADQCQKPTILGQLWGIKYNLAILLCLAAAAFLIAQNEFQHGVAVGITIAAMAACFGSAIRRARIAKALAEIGEDGV